AILLLFIANTISGLAQGISILAIPWYLTEITHEATFFGKFYLITTFISAFWGLYAGILIDKYDRKKILLVSALVGGVCLLAISYTGFRIGYMPSILAAIVFSITFLLFSIHYPNLYAFAQEITDKKDYGRITSWLEIQGQFTNAVSGAIGAVLLSGTEGGKLAVFGFKVTVNFSIKPWDLHEIFLVDGLTYFLAFTLLYFIRYIPVAERHPEEGNMLSRIKNGLNYLRQHKVLFIFGNASYFIFATVLVAHFYLMPQYIGDLLGGRASDFASSELFFAGGALLAGFLVSNIFKKTSTITSIIGMSLLVFVIFLFNVFNTIMFFFFFAYMLYGFCNAGTRIMRVTYLFNHIPNQIIGRTNGVFQVINILIRTIFLLIFSMAFFTRDDNIIIAFLILAVFVLIGALILIFNFKKLTIDDDGISNDPKSFELSKV
ncbi:MAG: MFS transporter, partial [Bacteroidetes bacterium]|nr:MFS transporter [Bacteroidota bacterium]